MLDLENEGRTEEGGEGGGAGNKVHRRSVHVGAFKISGIVCSLSHAPFQRGSHGNNSSRRYGPLSQKVRFYCTRDIEFRSARGETRLRKNGEKGGRAIASVTYDVRSLDTFCPLASDFRSFLSVSLAPRSRTHRSISLHFLYREAVKVVCTRTGWQIGRGISFYRMRGLHARKEVGKVSGRMQYSRRLGRQRMSSAHESGYPNEIQYGNVEDHPTDFTPCILPPLFQSPSYDENVVSSDTPAFVRFRHGSVMAPVASNFVNAAKFCEKEQSRVILIYLFKYFNLHRVSIKSIIQVEKSLV